MKLILQKIEEYILVLLLISMSIILFSQIIARYIFHNSIVWSEECVRYMFIWSTFIGIPYCIKIGNSLKIIQIIDLLPKKFVAIILYFNKIILFVFFSIMTIYSFHVTYSTYLSKQVSPALELPLWIVYLSTFIGFSLSVIRILEKIIKTNKNNITKPDY